jgi:hypothetical protein
VMNQLSNAHGLSVLMVQDVRDDHETSLRSNVDGGHSTTGRGTRIRTGGVGTGVASNDTDLLASNRGLEIAANRGGTYVGRIGRASIRRGNIGGSGIGRGVTSNNSDLLGSNRGLEIASNRGGTYVGRLGRASTRRASVGRGNIGTRSIGGGSGDIGFLASNRGANIADTRRMGGTALNRGLVGQGRSATGGNLGRGRARSHRDIGCSRRRATR